MTQDEIIEMARQANLFGIYADEAIDSVTRFAKLVAQHERDACAEVAMTLTRRMKETEKAHYNHSAEPFIAERFGFERGLILEGQKIADAIRAKG
jgi:hypothetical protein